MNKVVTVDNRFCPALSQLAGETIKHNFIARNRNLRHRGNESVSLGTY